MLCTDLHQLTEVLTRNNLHPSNADLISVVCGNCDKTEVCPAGSPEMDAQDGSQEQPEID